MKKTTIHHVRQWTNRLLLQFSSCFATVSAAFTFSEILGRKVGPGQANWLAAAYSSVNHPPRTTPSVNHECSHTTASRRGPSCW